MPRSWASALYSRSISSCRCRHPIVSDDEQAAYVDQQQQRAYQSLDVLGDKADGDDDQILDSSVGQLVDL